MALPASVTNNNAGTLADRLTYTLAAGVDAFGNQYYQSGSKYLFFNPSVYASPYAGWVLGNALNGSGAGQFDYATNIAGVTAASFPLTGWGIGAGAGTAPAPTFTAISGSAPASAPRIQPRVVVF